MNLGCVFTFVCYFTLYISIFKCFCLVVVCGVVEFFFYLVFFSISL